MLALVGHVVLGTVLLLVSRLHLNVPERKGEKTPPSAVTLRGLSSQQWAKNRGANAPNVKDERKAVAKKTPPAPDKKEPDPMPKGQVVDVAPGNKQVDPNAKYLAESNNAVKKESRAKEQTAFYRNAMPQRTATKPLDGNGSDAVEAAQTTGNEGAGQDDTPARNANAQKLTIEIPKVKARTEVALKHNDPDGPGAEVSNRTETEAVDGNGHKLRLQAGDPVADTDGSAGHLGHAGTLSLIPSPAVLDKINGAAANDHLQDVDEGDGTYLNTREWKFASFFNRVKQSVGQHWNPQAQLRLRDPTMQIYGGRDRYTLLAVTLDQSGRLRDAYVEKSSGLDFLDLEAVKAFERAQPFPNPPPGLIASDQSVHFQFGFFLEMSGRPGLRLFRSTE